MTLRDHFFQYVAQTSPAPPAIEITRASGVFLFGRNGKRYYDLISGISVSSLGHGNKKIVSAVRRQLARHSHVMVYGEYIQAPQVQLARTLVKHLPNTLDSVYFVSSGAEAVEGALKLAKRFTGRTEMISFRNAYHGSSHGALSVMGDEKLKAPFRPLLPDARLLEYNNEPQLGQITNKTACVIAEPVQGEAGVIVPAEGYLKKLRQRCYETGALLIFDEIQTGMGRTGKLFAFEHEGAVPDILCLAKAFGGGFPLGAFIASLKMMATLSEDPPLGHLTTFGGHPVCCAAGLEALKITASKPLLASVKKKENLFRKLLRHKRIRGVRGKGLLIAVEFESEAENKRIISRCAENGVLVDWFLFNTKCMRIAPPLTISEKEIGQACRLILKSMDTV